MEIGGIFKVKMKNEKMSVFFRILIGVRISVLFYRKRGYLKSKYRRKNSDDDYQ